jgi:hypothetical protein
MRLKIVSDGTANNTKFINAETEEELHLPVHKVTWEVTALGRAKAILEVEAIALEVNAEEVDILCEQCKHRPQAEDFE